MVVRGRQRAPYSNRCLSYFHPNIRDHIASFQSYYYGCAAAIVGDWWSHGAQRLPCTDHDFKECMGALDFMVQRYFKLPPLLHGHKEVMERTSKPGLSWLRLIALKAAASWCAVDWSAGRLAERCLAEGIAIPGSAGLDADGAAKCVGIAMAQAFAGEDLVVIDGIAVKRVHTTDTEGRQRKVYTFDRVKS